MLGPYLQKAIYGCDQASLFHYQENILREVIMRWSKQLSVNTCGYTWMENSSTQTSCKIIHFRARLCDKNVILLRQCWDWKASPIARLTIWEVSFQIEARSLRLSHLLSSFWPVSYTRIATVGQDKTWFTSFNKVGKRLSELHDSLQHWSWLIERRLHLNELPSLDPSIFVGFAL